MALPIPEPGLVIRFNYLWRRERDQGRDTARYPRPCAIVLSHHRAPDGLTMVIVAPITHSSPGPETHALEIPLAVKRHLGMDDDRSWIIVDEINEFAWPGFDLAPDVRGEIALGLLPPKLYDRLRTMVLERAKAGRLGRVAR